MEEEQGTVNVPIGRLDPQDIKRQVYEDGQEERNTEFILNNGIGMVATSPNSLISCINSLKKNPERYKILKQNMSRLKKPHATKNIVNFLLNLGSK
jgi:UDP-N-acetylglucosamine:LPS N-acetylglucosamine transferase